MKKLSEVYKGQGIAFEFPIEIKDANGKETYYEDSTGYWRKREYDSKGNETHCEDSKGYWFKREYKKYGELTCREDSWGYWYRA